MTDKTQLERINDIIFTITDSDDTLGFHERNRFAQQILDLCQPKWIDNRRPDKNGWYLTKCSNYSPYPMKVNWFFRGKWETTSDISKWMPLPGESE